MIEFTPYNQIKNNKEEENKNKLNFIPKIKTSPLRNVYRHREYNVIYSRVIWTADTELIKKGK